MKWIKRTAILVILSIILSYSCNLIVKKSTKGQIYTNINNVPTYSHALVLGTIKKSSSGINPYFKYRMEAAAELYKNGKAKKILVSGDNHIATYDETTDMKNYLMKLGVPENAIICDYAGFRTLDSVVRSQKVFHCKQLIIVSQKFHCERALFIANHIGIDAVAYCSEDVTSKSNYTHYREYLAKVAVILDLFVLNSRSLIKGHHTEYQ